MEYISRERLSLLGTDTFIAMWSVWLDLMPKALAGEDPGLLLRLLKITDVSAGVAQSSLRRALQVNQPKLSKLTGKLIKQKWLEVLPYPDDRRFLFVRTTRRAMQTVAAMETRLSSLLPLVRKPVRRRGLVATPTDTTLLDLLKNQG